MVQQGRAPENCQNRYFDRISESEAGRSKSKEERDKLYLSQLRIDSANSGLNPMALSFCRNTLVNIRRRWMIQTKSGSVKSYNMYVFAGKNFLIFYGPAGEDSGSLN